MRGPEVGGRGGACVVGSEAEVVSDLGDAAAPFRGNTAIAKAASTYQTLFLLKRTSTFTMATNYLRTGISDPRDERNSSQSTSTSCS